VPSEFCNFKSRPKPEDRVFINLLVVVTRPTKYSREMQIAG
jgi:hypothetical protein